MCEIQWLDLALEQRIVHIYHVYRCMWSSEEAKIDFNVVQD